MTSDSDYRIHSSTGPQEISHLPPLGDGRKRRRKREKRRSQGEDRAPVPDEETETDRRTPPAADDGEHLIDYFA